MNDLLTFTVNGGNFCGLKRIRVCKTLSCTSGRPKYNSSKMFGITTSATFDDDDGYAMQNDKGILEDVSFTFNGNIAPYEETMDI